MANQIEDLDWMTIESSPFEGAARRAVEVAEYLEAKGWEPGSLVIDDIAYYDWADYCAKCGE